MEIKINNNGMTKSNKNNNKCQEYIGYTFNCDNYLVSLFAIYIQFFHQKI